MMVMRRMTLMNSYAKSSSIRWIRTTMLNDVDGHPERNEEVRGAYSELEWFDKGRKSCSPGYNHWPITSLQLPLQLSDTTYHEVFFSILLLDE